LINGKKQLIIIAIASAAGFIISIGLIAGNVSKYSKYIPVEAKVAGVLMKNGVGTATKTFDVTYEFNVGGKQVQAVQGVNSEGGFYGGQTVAIRYNPENPTEIEDKSAIHTEIFFTSFLGIFTALLVVGIVKKG